MSSLRQMVVLIASGLFFVAIPARAAWEPPKDNAMTEKQVTAYVQVLKQALDDFRAAGNAAEDAKTSAGAVASYLKGDAKFKANLTSHNMTEDEYRWVGERMMDAWGATLSDQVLGNAIKGMAEQRKAMQQRTDEAKAKLAAYEKAQAGGRRVMTKEERQQAIDAAKSDQQSAQDEAKTARDESLAKAAGSKRRITDPDLPTTDDEKSEAKKQNDETIASLKSEILQAQQGMAQMDAAMADFAKNMQDQRAKNPIPPQNVELFKKHQAQWEAAWGMKADAK